MKYYIVDYFLATEFSQADTEENSYINDKKFPNCSLKVHPTHRSSLPLGLTTPPQSSALELQLEDLNTKLSYQDALLFYNIVESVKRQLHTAVVIATDLDTPLTGNGVVILLN